MKNLVVIVFASLLAAACNRAPEYYTFEDFSIVPKTDVHLHINSTDPVYIQLAEKNNFRIVSPNVDSRLPVDEQLATAASIARQWPGRFAFLGTFSVENYGKEGFADEITGVISKCMNEGAGGIKIWKNIGMVLRDSDSNYVMVDDPAFDPVFEYCVANKIPVMGHLGEPKNCWLPLSEMTDTGNYRYYKANPVYHMYLHPEAPSYEDQISARDNVLKKFPGLVFVGAHFASLEWSVDEISKRLDMFPGMTVDMSARMAHLQSQSIADYEKVRNFLLKYQDRILYGTDITVSPAESNPESRCSQILDRWTSNWVYLATDSTQVIRNLPAPVRGMQLPKKVIDKIFNTNAGIFF
jgi:predicted TIM-barrel fold metal-dependent hydrolase